MTCPIRLPSEGPLFTYYGSKWRAARHTLAPIPGLPVVEPFAGSACYSLRHGVRDAVIVEINPLLCAAWRFLIGADHDEILRTPVLLAGADIDAAECSEGARALCRLWATNGAGGYACRRVTRWGAMQWTPAKRARVARDAEAVKGWTLVEGGYADAPDMEATWYIDPPYRGSAGDKYAFKSNALNHEHLAAWCGSRRGAVIVCEGSEHGGWLPFQRVGTTFGAAHKTSDEYQWVRGAWPTQLNLNLQVTP